MQALARLSSGIFGVLQRSISATSSSAFHSLTQPVGAAGLLGATTPFNTSVRTIIRENFPRPSETKRIRKHGWKVRLQTKDGRRIIMRRLLKGRHVLSH